jgi:hypothetical protein
MTRQRQSSGSTTPNDSAEDGVFDAKTVVRPNLSRPTPPPLDRPTKNDDTPVPSHKRLSTPFDEHTMVALKKSATPQPADQPASSAQPKAIPLGPKPAGKFSGDEEGTWSTHKEDTDSGTRGGISVAMLKKEDRNKMLLRGLAVFAALMVITLIVRKCGKGNVEPDVTSDLSAESMETAPAQQKNKNKRTGSSSQNQIVDLSQGRTSTEGLLQEFDQAFLNSQAQAR